MKGNRKRSRAVFVLGIVLFLIGMGVFLLPEALNYVSKQ